MRVTQQMGVFRQPHWKSIITLGLFGIKGPNFDKLLSYMGESGKKLNKCAIRMFNYTDEFNFG
jgi:hypothetical protein